MVAVPLALAAAKSAARNLVSMVGACHALTQTYSTCGSGSTELDDGGIVGAVAAGSASGYVVTAVSGSGNTFTMTRDDALTTRTCSSTGTTDGGCRAGSW